MKTKSVKVKREKAARPEPFGDAEPDDHFIEAAWRYFDDFPKERQRHEHAFENRQDALVSWLDDSGLDDAAFALARHLIGEVFAMLELGAVTSVGRFSADAAKIEVPHALSAWAQEAVFQAATDEDDALDAEQSKELGRLVETGLNALWTGVANGGERPRR